MATTRKIGIFGGTFGPVHLGHLHLASLVQETLALDGVRFLPCQISPHKFSTPPARATDRLKMLHLATDGTAWAVVDDFELPENGPSFPFHTAGDFSFRYSGPNLNARIQILEEKGQVRVVSTPTLMIANNDVQAAELIESGKIMNDRLPKRFPLFSKPVPGELPQPTRKKRILLKHSRCFLK